MFASNNCIACSKPVLYLLMQYQRAVSVSLALRHRFAAVFPLCTLAIRSDKRLCDDGVSALLIGLLIGLEHNTTLTSLDLSCECICIVGMNIAVDTNSHLEGRTRRV